MRVRRLTWVGTRTAKFDETKEFFGSVLGLSLAWDAPGVAMFRLPGGEHDYVELGSIDDPYTAYMTTGPVPGFLVDSVVEAHDELVAAGVEIVEPIRWMKDVEPAMVETQPKLAEYAWFAFRAPDGNIYNCTQGSQAVVE